MCRKDLVRKTLKLCYRETSKLEPRIVSNYDCGDSDPRSVSLRKDWSFIKNSHFKILFDWGLCWTFRQQKAPEKFWGEWFNSLLLLDASRVSDENFRLKNA
jgi:hypothetical protein